MRTFLIQLDLADESVATIRARIADSDVNITREGRGFHIDGVATFAFIDQLGNGDRIYVVLTYASVMAWLDRFGVRSRTWLDAASDTTPRAVLGGVSPRAWLAARCVTDGAGNPLPPIVFAGQDPTFALEP